MTDTEQSSGTRLPQPRRTAHEGFYRAFEDRFRGSRELIRSRLRIYLPFIQPLKSIDDHPAAVDLGCGRGEWLELLAENGFDARGVDLDEGMLAACRENGLRVMKDDAIAFLKTLPNESQSIVSAFHIAEHLLFSELQMLVEQALRVLKPAGLLILETPNPENIRVSSVTFFFDPTHRHPLPVELLSFLPEYYGFGRIKVVRLQEDRDLLEAQVASLDQVLNSASADYAIIAQKAAERDVARLFDSEFNKNFGLSVHDLTRRFDRRLEAGLASVAELGRVREALRASSAWAESLQAHLLTKTEALATQEAKLARTSTAFAARDAELARTSAALAVRDAECAHTSEALARTRAALAAREADLLAIYGSTSWRISAPIRGASRAAHWFLRGARAWLAFRPGSRPRRLAQRLRVMPSPAVTSGTDTENFLQGHRNEGIPANIPPMPISNIVRSNDNQNMGVNILPTPVQNAVQHNHNVEKLAELSSNARVNYVELDAAIAKSVRKR